MIDAPHWRFLRRGQLWYDWQVNVVRRITKIARHSFQADDGHITYTWWADYCHDDAVVSTWCLLT